MANKISPKDMGLLVLSGSAVVVLTPLIAGAIGGIDFMATEIIPGLLSIGTALSAGVAAFATNWAIKKWL